MSLVEKCPQCQSENIYQDRDLWICPECGFEWSTEQVVTQAVVASEDGVKDCNGNLLSNGDSVIVVKDLKINGSSRVVKGGTKVRNIRLIDAGDGHNLSCKIEGLGSLNLKSEFVRKA